MTVIKLDIVGKISNATGIDMKSVSRMVEFILKEVKAVLQDGGEFNYRGFGKLTVRLKKARAGRNPKNMKPYEISERKVVTYTASKAFKKELNGR